MIQLYSKCRFVLSRPFITLLAILVVVFLYKFHFSSFLGRHDPVEYRGNIPLQELLIAAVDSAERGGKKVKMVRESQNIEEASKGKTAEGAKNPVTLGDRLSHREMYHSLKRRFPSLKIVSEEHEKSDDTTLASVLPANVHCEDISKRLPLNLHHVIPQDDITVWIDPLDATTEYTQQLTQYVTTMVCIAIKGVPTIGVIHNPFTKKTTWAWKGMATSAVMDVGLLSSGEPKVIISRSHAGSVNSSLQKSFDGKVKVIPAGGAGYKSLALIDHVADIYMHTTKIKKWDVCAGAAIVSSFGGQLTDLHGNEVYFDNAKDFVLKNGLLATMKDHASIVDKIKSISS